MEAIRHIIDVVPLWAWLIIALLSMLVAKSAWDDIFDN